MDNKKGQLKGRHCKRKNLTGTHATIVRPSKPKKRPPKTEDPTNPFLEGILKRNRERKQPNSTQQNQITPVKPLEITKDEDPIIVDGIELPDTLRAYIPDILRKDTFPYRTIPYDITPMDTLHILTEYAKTPMSINKICEKFNYPLKTFWLMKFSYQEIDLLYSKAQEEKAKIWAEEIHDIIDNETRDTVPLTTSTGDVVGYRSNPVAVQRDKLRIAGRQWLMGKYNQRYADKQAVDVRSLSYTITRELPDQAAMDKMDTDQLVKLFT